MAESNSHKKLKRKAAGKSGETEKKLSNGTIIDAVTKKKATEIERSGTKKGLEKAAQRLKNSRKSQKVLQVPQKDMKKGKDAMKKVGTSGTVKNMSGTKRISVLKKK
ncbi:hypothetical protein ES708_28904 [subsurface metagenome]